MAKEKKTEFDIAVIGGGPGGYPAAIHAAQLGKSVALIEANQLGGTCLNRGCIPSKALIAAAQEWQRVQHASEFGINVEKSSFNYCKMIERKDRIVDEIRSGLTGLIASNSITLFRGFGKFISPHEIKVRGEDNVVIRAKKTIIATGSEPRGLKAFPYDNEKILDSTALLAREQLPKSIVIIGGGIIGCEFASLYSLLGIKVTILELLPRILPMEDTQVSSSLTQAFKKRGVEIHCNVKVTTIDKTKEGVIVKLEDGASFPAEITLLSVGRSLNTSEVGLEEAGVLVNEQGLIVVNEQMETTTPGIYAVGDIASKWWLAHVATHQGVVAASNACGHFKRMAYEAVPSVIFTYPEIGTVGLTLDQALAKGYAATTGLFPFQALGKARATSHTEGFAQIVIDKRTQQILGAQVVGHEAATLISEMTVAVANELTVECITETIHAHPTTAESWMEAAFASTGMPLHLPPKKKG